MRTSASLETPGAVLRPERAKHAQLSPINPAPPHSRYPPPMPLRPPPLPVGIAVVTLALLGAGGTALSAAALFGGFHAKAALITAPGSAEVPAEPGAETLVWRELVGTHVTANRPLAPLPADLAITVTDAATGQPVPTRPYDWYLTQQLFGMGRERRSVVAFDAPASGRVLVDLRGSFPHELPFSVGSSIATFQSRVGLPIRAGFIAAGVLLLTGLTLCIWRAATPPTTDLPDLA